MSESVVQTKAMPKMGTRGLSRTQTIVLCAMFTVLTYIFTMIQINPLGIPGGLVHLGNVPFFIAAILFGKKIGAISGGVGMALFDLLSPYAIWAPATLLIGLATGFVVAWIAQNRSFLFCVLAMPAAAVVKVVGYYIAEGFIYGNWIAPALAIPANITQVVVAAVIVLLIIKPLQLASDTIISRAK